jgi:hypothetical protein
MPVSPFRVLNAQMSGRRKAVANSPECQTQRSVCTRERGCLGRNELDSGAWNAAEQKNGDFLQRSVTITYLDDSPRRIWMYVR